MDSSSTTPVRLAHVSDIHVTAPCPSWRREDWLNKRLAAWLNLRVLGRGYRFRRAADVLTAFDAEWAQRRPDCLLFSGDATAMGFEEETALATRLLRVEERPGLAVPGNHDYCTRTAMLSGIFERHFAPWQVGIRVDEAVYPYARRVGPVWLVAVNSATANRWAWDARGAVGSDQLDRLERLLPQLDEAPRILVTHYPIALASGQPERRVRLLRDLQSLIAVAARGGIALWLHGHRHNAYFHPQGELAPFPVICAGSTTQTGLWSYGEYIVDGRTLVASQRSYDPASNAFRAGPAFQVELCCPHATAVA
ncbi:MAG: metallophosphoesterase [Gemmataceae bacterium]